MPWSEFCLSCIPQRTCVY
uniref:Uncharacterized protein n=1 Tax=Arundo donax TaxID=35708 RepID=A0A0A8Z691_ARUDO